jgi:hypothetical protein
MRDVHWDEQPAPVGIAAGAANEVALRGGDHLGRILELAGDGLDRLALCGARLGEDPSTIASLLSKWL